MAWMERTDNGIFLSLYREKEKSRPSQIKWHQESYTLNSIAQCIMLLETNEFKPLHYAMV